MPWDRVWAVVHEASSVPDNAWARCSNFSRGAKAPALCAIDSELNEDSETLTLRHPDRPDLSFRPDHDQEAFLDWVRPLVPEDRAQPVGIVRLDGRGFTDSTFPSVSLCNLASHQAVSDRLGQDLSIHRWRGNIWFEGARPWAERDWIGKEVRIGECRLRIVENAERCMMTTANPKTGVRDADTLGALNTWGHQDFSVLAEVLTGGSLTVGHEVEVL
jgi:uncharacterized protein YcbX